MRHRLNIVLALLLAIPILGFAGLVAQREYLLANAPVINVAIRGVDPRDLLRGRYLVGDFDWEWDEAAAPTERESLFGRLCVTHVTGSSPGRYKVRFLEAGSEPPPDACRAVLNGRYTAAAGSVRARFMPDGIGMDYEARLRLYVPERQAARLEGLLVGRPGSVSVDLVVRPDDTAGIKVLRVDGVPLGR